MKNVVLSYTPGNYPSRCVLTGIQKFTSSRTAWNVSIYAFPADLTAEAVRRAPKDGIDGFIIDRVTDESVSIALSKTPLPVSIIDMPYDAHLLGRTRASAMVENRNRDVGRLGAQHFLGLGRFKSYAFVPYPEDLAWSVERMEGFVAELKQHGIRTTILRDTHEGIRRLPKPAAVMAAWDNKAIEIMACAKKEGFRVPADIAVVGVDADPIVCGFSNPPLTSVAPDFERLGYSAAAALDAMMNGRKLKGFNRIFVPPKGVVERASTDFIPTGQSLVDRARTIIEREAANGLTATALSIRLNVSPQLLALRFRQFDRLTPRELIIQTRLNKAKHLLLSSNERIDSIAEQCGFSSKNRLFHVFKERFGMTIGEFRSQA